jgi:G8 domain
MTRANTKTVAVAAFLIAAVLAFPTSSAEAQKRGVESCLGGAVPPTQDGSDLIVNVDCNVGAGTYKFGNVNIIAGGALRFADATIDFWAANILVENGGSFIAGSPSAPIGTQGGVVTIHLYGKDLGPGTGNGDGGQGIVCVTDTQCGIPANVWNSNGSSKVSLPGGVSDYFYQYQPLEYDDGGTIKGFFGYKVLAVGFGGTLQLFGKKGATYGAVDSSNSGTSWVRLAQTLNAGGTQLVLDRPVDWQAGDQIVVTTTDYLPGHSEQFTIASVSGTSVIVTTGAQHDHNGQPYSLGAVPARLGLDFQTAETRAAVALLTRSIRIVSEGDALDQPFPSGPGNFFGGHTIVRQGVAQYQIQGVEFYQLGQGGRKAHYPVHFHMARQTPNDTFVMDSSVHDSMTRWYVVHATHGVTFARNVGYLSIGHGYYIEDGSEINNRFLSNIGIFARAAVDNDQNPRKVPGILAAQIQLPPWSPDNTPFYTDYDHPSVFWIMNGWNDFEYNMTVGAGTCGACYWLVPGANSGHSRHMTWESYASLQADPTMQNPLARAAMTPLKTFVGNYCSTAMNSFNTIGDTTQCLGVGSVAGRDPPALAPVVNPLAPDPCDQTNMNPSLPGKACNLPANKAADDYYPKVNQGSGRFATRCDGTDCSTVPRCDVGQLQNCMITALDRYTSSFHWTETNFAAIWLRQQWYLVVNSVLTDVQNGGLTMVTGGGYTSSDVIPGHWALARKSVFVGNTQTGNPYASNAGPFNPQGLQCDAVSGNHCLSAAEGVSFPISSFGVNQRLFNIYDGPAYQDSNAYLDINPVVISDCHPSQSQQTCVNSQWLAGRTLGLPQDDNGVCYMPNAAIAWKQPNGFYYPPAFHSTNLFFNNVEIRHFVIEPLFQPGTFTTDPVAAQKRYCNWNTAMFNGFTDIDRQTELNDDDGSLTGLVNTISVNQDPFFNAPVEASECASDVTAKTSPYDYVTTVVYPGCALNGSCSEWSSECSNEVCYGVPLYRQYITATEQANGEIPSIRMMGQHISQRSNLTANNGQYYIDTTVGLARQQQQVGPVPVTNVNVFTAGQTYYVFLLFAKPPTRQTYQLYVGKDPGFNPSSAVVMTRVNLANAPFAFSPGLWPSTWTRQYNAATGILTVTMDMAFTDFEQAYANSGAGNCGPSSFCTWNAQQGQCGCALKPGDYLFAECSEKNSAGQDAICSWAVKDFECPSGGCFGFAVTLPGSFATDPATNPLPAAACFPKDANWDVTFTQATGELAGSCVNPPIPAANFCAP